MARGQALRCALLPPPPTLYPRESLLAEVRENNQESNVVPEDNTLQWVTWRLLPSRFQRFHGLSQGFSKWGRAKKCEQEKTVRDEEEGLQKVPSFLLLFFFPLRSSFRFTLHYLNAWNKQEISRVSVC